MSLAISRIKNREASTIEKYSKNALSHGVCVCVCGFFLCICVSCDLDIEITEDTSIIPSSISSWLLLARSYIKILIREKSYVSIYCI